MSSTTLVPLLAETPIWLILSYSAVIYAFGILSCLFYTRLRRHLWQTAETQKQTALEQTVEHLKTNFSSMSVEALAKVSQQLTDMAKVQLAAERDLSTKDLEQKKGLIDVQLERMGKELDHVGTIVKNLEKDREIKFTELSERLRVTNEQTANLIDTTTSLKQVLADSQARGQWGERIAEDVLKISGFVEHVNYKKQQTINEVGTIPDFTFMLPNDLTLNMDVKFPLANYFRLVKASTVKDKAQFKRDFLADIKKRIKEVSARAYINPNQNTVDCVLMFIPNEQVFTYVQAEAPELMDEALRQKVVTCSPLTLFAVLAVIRQATDFFVLEQTSQNILGHLGEFKKQWRAYVDKFSQLGTKIDGVKKEYDILLGARTRQLEKPLEKLERLRVDVIEKKGDGLVRSGASTQEHSSRERHPQRAAREDL